MSNCNTIIGLTASCNDNNAGSIKKAWIADFLDVEGYTEASGEVTGLTMSGSETFKEFTFQKNTSSYTENKVGDFVADVHLWEQSISLGLRRIEVAKRNAISLLAEGRRRLVIIILDNNDEYRIFGLDDGLRLGNSESGTNETRNAGTFYTLPFMGEERWQAYFTDEATVLSVI